MRFQEMLESIRIGDRVKIPGWGEEGNVSGFYLGMCASKFKGPKNLEFITECIKNRFKNLEHDDRTTACGMVVINRYGNEYLTHHLKEIQKI